MRTGYARGRGPPCYLRHVLGNGRAFGMLVLGAALAACSATADGVATDAAIDDLGAPDDAFTSAGDDAWDPGALPADDAMAAVDATVDATSDVAPDAAIAPVDVAPEAAVVAVDVSTPTDVWTPPPPPPPPPPACTSGICDLYTISYAPNSFVIGNAYPGWTDTLHGTTVFQAGPGNPTGTNYQCGFLFGENFSHCGWVARSVVRGTADTGACGTGCPRTYDTALFLATYTNGMHSAGAGDGTDTHMHYAGSGCTTHDGYGNVEPWRVPATPANLVGVVPDGRLLRWRYVSKDGQWVLVHDPTPGASPNWYFVHRGCVSTP